MTRNLILVAITLLVVAVAAATIYLFTLPGGVTIDAFGLDVSLNIPAALALLLALGVTIAVATSFLSGVLTLPGKIGKSRQASKVRKANKALADGLLAAEAGDAQAARRFAKKAAANADDERLKLLLDARTAEAAADWIGAERAWGQLTRLPGGQLAGLRGAAAAAMERGDRATAEVNAREALAIDSGAEWPFDSLFNLQVAQGAWEKALDTLAKGEKRGLVSGDGLRRRRAVLQTAFAAGLPNARRLDAQRALADAIKAAPGFPPAAWHGAKHLIADGKGKSAQGILELAWRARPHPALARLARGELPDETPEAREKRLKALIAANPDHRESRILKAEMAMDARRWADAVRSLAQLIEESPTARLCLLMERALKGYGDAEEAARWGRMAASAAREADWSDLDPKGEAFAYGQEDWSRLVFTFGDAAQLVHPRYEAFDKELEAGRAIALPAPDDAKQTAAVPSAPRPAAAPLDYVADED
ncbi:MAG: heme biosynthesis HemY N-terminal domain-containing protein [Pseudomonadota bacterium]